MTITRSGLIELNSGWSIAVGASAQGQVRLVLQFDPSREIPAHGVKTLAMTTDEALELERAIAAARSLAER